MFNFFRNDAEIWKIRWLEHLHRRSANVNEWKELAALVGRLDFRLQKRDRRLYLVSNNGVSKDRFLMIDTRFLDSEPLPSPHLPEWIRPLYDLKWADGDNIRKEVSLRDGIAGLAGERSARAFFAEEPTRFARLTGYANPDPSGIPEDLETLQMSRSGRLFFMNSKKRVFLYSIAENGFKNISGLSNFMNFCIHSIVENRDWYLDGYSVKADTVYYDVVNI